MAKSIDMLAPDHRIAHYRALIAEVQYLANESQFEEVRTQFLELAKRWQAIADQLERKLIEEDLLPRPAARNFLTAA